MKPRPALALLAALAYLSAAPLLRADDPDAGSENGAVIFDGAVKRQADTASFSPAADDKARLTAELKKHITINDHGNPDERIALDSMISRLMDSATARETAVKFIEEDAKAVVSLEELPDSAVVTVDGKKTFWGTFGGTDPGNDPPGVELNKLFMQYNMDDGIGTLAHEIFGHAFEQTRARIALANTHRHNTNDEENARLIGWLVCTELNIKPTNEIWAYMQNPEGHIESLTMLDRAYSLRLTSEDMKDPVSIYKNRLVNAEKEAEKLREKSKRYAEWGKAVDHLITRHQMDPASFQAIKNDIDNELKVLPSDQKSIEEITAVLQARINFFASANGKVFLERLAKDSDNDYFKRKDAVIKERRKRLEGLLLAKTPDTSRPPPPAGQFTWQQFAGLCGKDKDACPFGGIK